MQIRYHQKQNKKCLQSLHATRFLQNFNQIEDLKHEK